MALVIAPTRELALQVSRELEWLYKAAGARPGLVGAERQQLVGLRAQAPITAGAHLFRPGDRVHRETDQGYVTSVCWSDTLNCWLAMAFLENGRARHGESIRLIDHLRDIDVICEVADPVFFDKEGAKLRA